MHPFSALLALLVIAGCNLNIGGNQVTVGENATGSGSVDVVGSVELVGLVSASGAQVALVGTDILNTQTGANGQFIFKKVAAGNYIITATAGDHTLEKLVRKEFVVAQNNVDIGALQLTPTGILRGRVFIENQITGNIGISVFIPGTNYVGMTDDGGNYQIVGVPIGTYDIAAQRAEATLDSRTGIVVQFAQTTNVPDLLLQLVAAGGAGINCWDTNQNGIPNFPGEDANNDGSINVLDCKGATGPAGPQGPKGDPGDNGSNGTNGSNGQNGVSCWDLNANFVGDPFEDLNGDLLVNVLDCQGGGGWAWGGVKGTVQLTGQADHSGILVSLLPLGITTYTAANGSYHITAPPGNWSLVFTPPLVTAPAHISTAIDYLRLYPGITETIPKIVLPRGVWHEAGGNIIAMHNDSLDCYVAYDICLNSLQTHLIISKHQQSYLYEISTNTQHYFPEKIYLGRWSEDGIHFVVSTPSGFKAGNIYNPTVLVDLPGLTSYTSEELLVRANRVIWRGVNNNNYYALDLDGVQPIAELFSGSSTEDIEEHALSPDGRYYTQIYTTEISDSTHYALKSYDLSTVPPTNIPLTNVTSYGLNNLKYSDNPQNQWLVYSNKTAPTYYSPRVLHVMRPDGSNKKLINPQAYYISEIKFTPDATKLVFSAMDVSYITHLYVVNLNTNSVVEIDAGGDLSIILELTNNHIFYQRAYNDNIIVYSLTTSTSTELPTYGHSYMGYDPVLNRIYVRAPWPPQLKYVPISGGTLTTLPHYYHYGDLSKNRRYLIAENHNQPTPTLWTSDYYLVDLHTSHEFFIHSGFYEELDALNYIEISITPRVLTDSGILFFNYYKDLQTSYYGYSDFYLHYFKP